MSRAMNVRECGGRRSGLYKGEPYFEGAGEARMGELAEWVEEADRLLTF